MRKILAFISNEDKNNGIKLAALLETYKTLLKIDGYDINKIEVEKKIEQTKKELKSFWDCISEKYMFPVYLDKVMKINYDDNSVYIDV